MSLIPDEVFERYNVRIATEETGMEDMYRSFLAATDHIPNKIVESLITVLHESTALNFISTFINWLHNEYNEYADVISYRNIAREEINKIVEDS